MRLENLYPSKTSLDKSKEGDRAVAFEQQWQGAREIEVAAERVRVYDMQPKEAKTQTPTLVVPGWVTGPGVFKEHLRTLVESGRRAISVDAPHGVAHEIDSQQAFGEVANSELRRIAAFMGALDASGIEKTDAIGHSEGGFDVALAAAMYPERFGNIILVDPAGIIGSDSVASLAARFTWDQVKGIAGSLRDGTLSARIDLLNKGAPATLLHPVHSWREVRSLAAANILDLLTHIKSQGIGVVIIHGADDTAFPMERAQKEIQKTVVQQVGPREDMQTRNDERLEQITGQVLDGFISVKGGHADFIVHAPEYTRLAEGQLTALEARRSQ
jgi:pimeloyl-ACP methyl ester carboxylesterase